MSDAAAPAEAGAPAEGQPKKKFRLSFPMLLVFVHTLSILGVTGFLAYSRFIFKRPAITEEQERETIKKTKVQPTIAKEVGTMILPTITVNISTAAQTPAGEGARGAASTTGGDPMIRGKFHYASFTIALQLSDIQRKSDVEKIQAILLDKVVSSVGRKTFQELTNVQGRYLLRQQILEWANKMLPTPLVMNVFFTQYAVQ